MKWKISTSKVTGTVHDSDMCQDYCTHLLTDDYAFIVACDGASSASRATEASKIAATTMCMIVENCSSRLFDMDDDELRTLIAGTIHTALDDAAKAAGCTTDDYLTTLVALFCTPGQYLAINIGDGLAGFIPDDEGLAAQTLLAPVNGRYANSCYFISQEDAASHIAIARGKFCTEATYFLMTDGTVHCLYNKAEQTYAPALRAYSGWLLKYAYNKAQSAVTRSIKTLFPQLTPDDCTLVMLRADK